MVMLFEKTPRPSKSHPGQFADLAVRAVSAHQVVRTQPADLGARVQVLHRGRHAGRILVDADDLGSLEHTGPGFLGPGSEDRLQAWLRHEQPPGRY